MTYPFGDFNRVTGCSEFFLLDFTILGYANVSIGTFFHISVVFHPISATVSGQDLSPRFLHFGTLSQNK